MSTSLPQQYSESGYSTAMKVSLLRSKLLKIAIEGLQPKRGFFHYSSSAVINREGQTLIRPSFIERNEEEKSAKVRGSVSSKRKTAEGKIQNEETENSIFKQSGSDIQVPQIAITQHTTSLIKLEQSQNQRSRNGLSSEEKLTINEEGSKAKKERCLRGIKYLRNVADDLKPKLKPKPEEEKEKIEDLQLYSSLGPLLEKIIQEDPSFSPSSPRVQYDSFSQAFEAYHGSKNFKKSPEDVSLKAYHSEGTTKGTASQKTSLGSSLIILEEREAEWSPQSVDQDIILGYTRLLKEQEESEKRVFTEESELLERRRSSSSLL